MSDCFCVWLVLGAPQDVVVLNRLWLFTYLILYSRPGLTSPSGRHVHVNLLIWIWSWLAFDIYSLPSSISSLSPSQVRWFYSVSILSIVFWGNYRKEDGKEVNKNRTKNFDWDTKVQISLLDLNDCNRKTFGDHADWRASFFALRLL